MIKTDLIEIFQTIRAQMQPYTVEGFKNKINTDLRIIYALNNKWL